VSELTTSSVKVASLTVTAFDMQIPPISTARQARLSPLYNVLSMVAFPQLSEAPSISGWAGSAILARHD
jgi:hypothetical protein